MRGPARVFLRLRVAQAMNRAARVFPRLRVARDEACSARFPALFPRLRVTHVFVNLDSYGRK